MRRFVNTLKTNRCFINAKRRCRAVVLVLLVAATFGYGLGTSTPAVKADEQTETYVEQVTRTETYVERVPVEHTYNVRVPYREKYTVSVPYTQTYTVQVPYQHTYNVRVPYREKYTVSVPYTQTYTVQVPYKKAVTVRVPFQHTYNVRVPYKQSYRARVAPYTRKVPTYNYVNKRVCRPPRGCHNSRVRVAPFTRTVAAYNYQTRTRTAYRTEQRTRTAYRNENRSVTAYRSEQRTRTAYRNETKFKTVWRTEQRTRTAYRSEERTRTAYRNETKFKTVYRTEQRTRTIYRDVTRTRDITTPITQTRPKQHIHHCPKGQQLVGHDQCVTPTTTTTTTTVPPTTTTVPPTTTTTSILVSPVSSSIVARPTNLQVECSNSGISTTWNVIASFDSLETRKFDVELNGEVVDSAFYQLGLNYVVFVFNAGIAGESYSLRVREAKKEHDLDLSDGVDTRWEYSPWTPSTKFACPLFVPGRLMVDCNSHGVVTASWEATRSSKGYLITWSPQHEVNNNRTILLTSNNYVVQGEEGGRYIVGVSSRYAKGRSQSTTQEIACPEVNLSLSMAPNRLPNDNLQIDDHVLRSRICRSSGKERTCAEIWDQHVTIKIDKRPFWKKIPLLNWGDQYSAGENLATLGALVAAYLTRGQPGSGQTRLQRNSFAVSLGFAGASQGFGTLKIEAEERVFLSVSSYSNGSNIRGCIPGYYSVRQKEIPRVTKKAEGLTTHRDITLNYCEED